MVDEKRAKRLRTRAASVDFLLAECKRFARKGKILVEDML